MALSRKKKIIIAVVVVAVLASIVVVSVIATRKEEPEVVTVKIESRPELKQTVTASGEIRPIRYIKLTSEVPGRIEEIVKQLRAEKVRQPARSLHLLSLQQVRVEAALASVNLNLY